MPGNIAPFFTNMNKEIEHAMQFFEAFLQVHGKFSLFNKKIASFSSVVNSRLFFGHRVAENPLTKWFDLSVMVEDVNANDIDWHFEFIWVDCITIRRSINKRMSSWGESETVVDFDDVVCHDMNGLIHNIVSCADALLSRVDVIN